MPLLLFLLLFLVVVSVESVLMWHLMRKGNGLLIPSILSALLLSRNVLAQEVPIFPPISTVSDESARATILQPRIGTGIGAFQNIVLPIDEGRIDENGEFAPDTGGTTPQLGVPLIVGTSFVYSLFDLPSRVDLLSIIMNSISNETPGQKGTPGYSRFMISNTSRWQLRSLSPLFVDTGIMVRRSLYRDGAYTHAVDALAPELSTGFDYARWSFRLHYSRSLWTKFGFADRMRLDYGRVSRARVQMQNYGLQTGLSFGENSSLELSVEREVVNVVQPIFPTYDKFGLAKPNDDKSKRTLYLNTTLFSVSLVRRL